MFRPSIGKLVAPLVVGLMFVGAEAQDRAPALNWTEQLGIALVAKELGINPDVILGHRRQDTTTVYDLAPVYSFHKEARVPADEVWRLRRQGLGWGQIAQRLNIHPGTFNKMRNAGAFDRNVVWRDILNRRYGLSETDIKRLRSQGLDWDAIAATAHISHRTGASRDEVLRRYRDDRNWDRVRTRYSVKDSWGNGRWDANWDRGRSAQARAAAPGQSGVKGSNNRGNAAGKGKAKGKGQNQGKGKGKGKGGGRG